MIGKRKLSKILAESAEVDTNLDLEVDSNCFIWRAQESVNATKTHDMLEVKYAQLTTAITFLALAKVKLDEEINDGTKKIQV